MKKKKIIIGVISICVCLLLIYSGVHFALNRRFISEYANGYEKNTFGDYCYSEDEYIAAVYKAPFTSLETNLSISTDNIDLVIWCSLVNDNHTYGIIVNDEESETSYQIEVDENFKATEKDRQEILDQYSDEVERLKVIVAERWDIII